jgi:hypothetical protein
MVAVTVLAGCGEGLAPDEAWTEPDTGLAVVDGDVLAGGEAGAAASLAQPLTVARTGGRDDLWAAARRQALTYCIDVKGFGRWAGTVQAAMEEATADWERSGHVHFVHLAAEDARCTAGNSRVVFDVRRVSKRPYLARSFFPSSPRSAREVLIDDSTLPAPRPLTLGGVLKHELGHVLGLRHEHTRKTSNPCYEDAQWRAVTSYDATSVMHYPQCLGVTGRDLALSALDRKGVGLLYP